MHVLLSWNSQFNDFLHFYKTTQEAECQPVYARVREYLHNDVFTLPYTEWPVIRVTLCEKYWIGFHSSTEFMKSEFLMS